MSPFFNWVPIRFAGSCVLNCEFKVWPIPVNSQIVLPLYVTSKCAVTSSFGFPSKLTLVTSKLAACAPIANTASNKIIKINFLIAFIFSPIIYSLIVVIISLFINLSVFATLQ